MVLVTFPERKVTRRKGGTITTAHTNNGYTQNPGTPETPHRSLRQLLLEISCADDQPVIAAIATEVAAVRVSTPSY
jgi:hypothetical protein